MSENTWVCKKCGSPIEFGLTCPACGTSLCEKDLDMESDVIKMQLGLRMLFEMKKQRAELARQGYAENGDNTHSQTPLPTVGRIIIQMPTSAIVTKGCVNCGTQNRNDARFCKECGNKFPE